MFEQDFSTFRLSGTTASAALIDSANGHVAIAHVGDSALVLTQNERVIHKSMDHKLHLDVDCKRIRAHGGEVRARVGANGRAPGAVPRVHAPGQNWPGLAMSRSLGDLEAHRLGVLAEPDICAGLPFGVGSCLIVASDGIWDQVSGEAAAALVAKRGQSAGVAKALALDARSRYAPEKDIDDITVVIAFGHSMVDMVSDIISPLPPSTDAPTSPLTLSRNRRSISGNEGSSSAWSNGDVGNAPMQRRSSITTKVAPAHPGGSLTGTAASSSASAAFFPAPMMTDPRGIVGYVAIGQPIATAMMPMGTAMLHRRPVAATCFGSPPPPPPMSSTSNVMIRG